jgi:hypothetical protein
VTEGSDSAKSAADVAKDHLRRAFATHHDIHWTNAELKAEIEGKNSHLLRGEIHVRSAVRMSFAWSNYAAGPAPQRDGARPEGAYEQVTAELEGVLANDPLAVYRWKHGEQDHWGFSSSSGELGRFRIHLESERTCGSCNGSTQLTCRACGGMGEQACYSCNGGGSTTCSGCGWTGQEVGSRRVCHICFGTLRLLCRGCGGAGRLNCPPCSATGQVSCEPCAATGVVHSIGSFTVSAQIETDHSVVPETDSQRAWIAAIKRDALPAVAAPSSWEVVSNKNGAVVLKRPLQLRMSEGLITVQGLRPQACAAVGSPSILLPSAELKRHADTAEFNQALRLLPTLRRCILDGIRAKPFPSPHLYRGAFKRIADNPTCLARPRKVAHDTPVQRQDRIIARRWVRAFRTHITATNIERTAMFLTVTFGGFILADVSSQTLGLFDGRPLRWPSWASAGTAAAAFWFLMVRSPGQRHCALEAAHGSPYRLLLLPVFLAILAALYPRAVSEAWSALPQFTQDVRAALKVAGNCLSSMDRSGTCFLD